MVTSADLTSEDVIGTAFNLDNGQIANNMVHTYTILK